MREPTADLVPLAFADLPGWREATLAPTFRAFRRAAPRRIAHPDIPVPFTPVMEHFVLPDADKVTAAALTILEP